MLTAAETKRYVKVWREGMFHKCKITVVKRSVNTDLINEYVIDPKIFPICNKV